MLSLRKCFNSLTGIIFIWTADLEETERWLKLISFQFPDGNYFYLDTGDVILPYLGVGEGFNSLTGIIFIWTGNIPPNPPPEEDSFNSLTGIIFIWTDGVAKTEDTDYTFEFQFPDGNYFYLDMASGKI